MSRFHRHLEGWQLGVVTVGSALVAAALGVPRAIPPHEIPLPAVDRAEERRMEAAQAALVAGARSEPLAFRVRAVGEALRRFGDAEARADVAQAAELSRDVAARAAEARTAHGDGPLLALRAVQVDLFVRAVRRFADSGAEDPDIAGLGGSFVRRGRQNGWISSDRRLVIEPEGVAAIFVMRWTKLAGLLDTHPFAPSLNEWRLYFRTLMAHPESSGRDPEAEALLLASYVTGLCRHDPDYPELLARGILEYRMRNYAASAEALSAHLREHPDGPWWLRARNYLAAAEERLPPPEEP